MGEVDEVSLRVVHRRTVDADPAIVWRALTERAGLSAWLGRLEGPALGPGVVFALWHEEQIRSSHEVVEWAPQRRVKFTWDFPGEVVSRVQFAVEPGPGGTSVRLEHEGAEDPVAYAAGWHTHLDLLADYATGRPRSFDHFWDDYEELLPHYRARRR